MADPVVVVGAGVAGCVAARTIADAGIQVVVVEPGPGPDRPAAIDSGNHLRSAEATDWWFPGDVRRGRGWGGGSAVNGGLLHGVDPLDARRWGWDDVVEHQAAVLARWPRRSVEPGPFTAAFAPVASAGFPLAAPTDRSGGEGWLPLTLSLDDAGRRVTAADVFLADAPSSLRVVQASVDRIDADGTVDLDDGRSIAARHVVVAAGASGSPELVRRSGLVADDDVVEPSNHPSTAVIVELDESLHATDLGPPSSGMLRFRSGLSENRPDVQILPLDHTGEPGHAAVIVSALEVERIKVLVAGIEQVLRWLARLDGIGRISISDDRTPVQHQCATLVRAPRSDRVTVVDSSVLPALPHTNPMLAVAVGARRRAVRLLAAGVLQ